MLHHIAAVGSSLAKRYIEVVEVNDPNGDPSRSRPPGSPDEAVLGLLPLALHLITAIFFIFPFIGVSRHLLGVTSPCALY